MENIYLQLIGYTLYGVISFGACLSGSEADKVFHNQLMSSKERLALEFAKVKDAHSSEAHLGCKLCNSPMLGENIKTITINKIPDECIAGALKRSVQQQSVVCKGEFPVKKTNLSAKDYPCVTDDVASYLSYTVNRVISCLNNIQFKSGRNLSIFSKTVFEKINNESGFNFSATSLGGVGIGQLTTSAVAEMNVNTNLGVNGNGRYILDAILDSKHIDCEILKGSIIAYKERGLSNPRTPVCEWISVDKGAVKNLIYSIGYFAYFKDQLVQETQRLSVKIDDAYLDKLALISYYSGPVKGKAYLRDWKRNEGDLAQIKIKIDGERYIKAIKEKFVEAVEKSGGTCQFI